MKNKTLILDTVENGAKVVNRVGDVVAEGSRIENNFHSFKLSDGAIILFSQVASVEAGKVVLK